MVMGMRPEEVMEAALQPRNLASGAQWAFPPTMLMSARNDQDDIIGLVNRTQTHLQSQVCWGFKRIAELARRSAERTMKMPHVFKRCFRKAYL